MAWDTHTYYDEVQVSQITHDDEVEVEVQVQVSQVTHDDEVLYVATYQGTSDVSRDRITAPYLKPKKIKVSNVLSFRLT